MKPEPFQIHVPEAVLDDLRRRLRQTRFTTGLRDDTWDFGTSPQYLRELVKYWLESYDWRAREAALNQLPSLPPTSADGSISFTSTANSQRGARCCSFTAGPIRFFAITRSFPC